MQSFIWKSRLFTSYTFHSKKKIEDSEFGGSVVPFIVPSILTEGRRSANTLGYPNGLKLVWKWHEKVYLGAAHGIVGILYLLFCFMKDISTWKDGEEWIQLMKETIETLNSSSCLNSGNLALELFDDIKYYKLAKCIAQNVIWPRGLLRKGVGLCHGISVSVGNLNCSLSCTGMQLLDVLDSFEPFSVNIIMSQGNAYAFLAVH